MGHRYRTHRSRLGGTQRVQVDGNAEAQRQTPMFGRAALTILASKRRPSTPLRRFLSPAARATGSSPTSDPYSASFSAILTDGLEGEVCLPNPDAQPGAFNPPGTPATRFSS
jgi:hypothetical protein